MTHTKGVPNLVSVAWTGGCVIQEISEVKEKNDNSEPTNHL